jgi:hypothetical protein
MKRLKLLVTIFILFTIISFVRCVRDMHSEEADFTANAYPWEIRSDIRNLTHNYDFVVCYERAGSNGIIYKIFARKQDDWFKLTLSTESRIIGSLGYKLDARLCDRAEARAFLKELKDAQIFRLKKEDELLARCDKKVPAFDAVEIQIHIFSAMKARTVSYRDPWQSARTCSDQKAWKAIIDSANVFENKWSENDHSLGS